MSTPTSARPSGPDQQPLRAAKDSVAASIRARAAEAISLSHRLHAHPEVAYQEHVAVRELTDLLVADGFVVESGLHGLDTAFSATAGDGAFRAVLIAEYDALPEVGHACGHNVIAATTTLAAWALHTVAADGGLTIQVVGTPAEETGGGKLLLTDRGTFDGAGAVMMVHPAPFEDATPSFLAATVLRFEFKGRSSHSSAAPTEAINAADAATVAQVAVGLLRQQLSSDVRVHALTEQAGSAVNVIPGESRVSVDVRARTMELLEETTARVRACFEGAAHATGCVLTHTAVGHVYPHVVQSPRLAELYVRNAETLGRQFSREPAAAGFVASTDFGAVSQVAPSLHPHIAICDPPVANHQSAFALAAISERADQAIVDGATAMAWTLLDASVQRSARADTTRGES